MAAAVIPVLITALPLLMPVIKSLVLHVEHLFGAGTGPAKMSAVVNALGPLIAALGTAGIIPGAMDPAATVALVEAIVDMMRHSGQLNPDTAAAFVKEMASAAQPVPKPQKWHIVALDVEAEPVI